MKNQIAPIDVAERTHVREHDRQRGESESEGAALDGADHVGGAEEHERGGDGDQPAEADLEQLVGGRRGQPREHDVVLLLAGRTRS